MKTDLYRQVTDSIVAQLEAGVQPWFRPWSVQGRASRPLRSTGQEYRGINVLLLWVSALEKGYASPFWFSYKQASEIGAQVRKGECGTTVVYFGTMERTETGQDGEDVDYQIPFLKGYHVFNADQIDGLPKAFTAEPQPVETYDNRRIAVAEAFVKGTGADIRHGGDSAFYRRSDDYIQMPEFDRFQDEKHYYATILHELGHYSGAERRLNRRFDGSGRFGGEGYAMEELVCELTACFLAADLGLYVEPRADHASYLASWLKALRADRRAIFTAASHAQKAADYLHGLQAQALSDVA